MASVMMTCDICYSNIYVTDEEIKSDKTDKAYFGFVSTDNETKVCQYCIRRIKSRYLLQKEVDAIQIVKDFSTYDLRHVLGLS